MRKESCPLKTEDGQPSSKMGKETSEKQLIHTEAPNRPADPEGHADPQSVTTPAAPPCSPRCRLGEPAPRSGRAWQRLHAARLQPAVPHPALQTGRRTIAKRWAQKCPPGTISEPRNQRGTDVHHWWNKNIAGRSSCGNAQGGAREHSSSPGSAGKEAGGWGGPGGEGLLANPAAGFTGV